MNTGNKIIKSKNKLLSTICYRINNKNIYALEGSIFMAGASISWLRDKLKIIDSERQVEQISRKLKSNSNVYFVPAFTGLGAPYWRPDARATLVGLTRNSGREEIIRATLESVVYQTSDLFNSMRKDGLKPNVVKIDGGMVENNWFNQFLSNILGLKVFRPKVYETTALGVALIAGYGCGIFRSISDIKKKWKLERKFRPKMTNKHRLKLLNGWSQAIRKTLS
tara:strand:- start:109 stop:777 length:669 start_codon:yes stop_codon:yes gene_type:complete